MNAGELRKLLSEYPDDLAVQISVIETPSDYLIPRIVNIEEDDVQDYTTTKGDRVVYIGRSWR